MVQQQQHHQRNCHDFGDKGQGLFMDLCRSLEYCDHKTDDDADGQQRSASLKASMIACWKILITCSCVIRPLLTGYFSSETTHEISKQ